MPASPSSSVSSPHSGSSSSLIRLSNVSKRYLMGSTLVQALRNVTLAIPPGEFVAIVGPSGSGKSTLLHLLAAMDRPTEGRVTVGDWEVSTLDRPEQAQYRRTMVGMIFQRFHLVPTMTARENVELPLVLAGVPPETRRPRAMDCLRMVGLEARADHRPNELSGGEQQRVATARALVGDPPILLADEPTGNLDSTTGSQIVGLLEDLHHEQERTVVVVTHHYDEIAHVAERVIELKDGRVEAVTEPSALS